MPTAFNSTVKVYKGIPLVKGGTEVLYLSGASAEAQLTAGATDVKTYNQYYYTRENRRAIQIDAPIQDLEGYNYVGFQNASHGGKWYFGFIDEVVYINDNNTEIHFTTDPFTTFLEDTKEKKPVFIVRNTVKPDTARANLQPDYTPATIRTQYTNIANYQLVCNQAKVYFACATQIGVDITGLDDQPTGIQVGMVLPNTVDIIHQNGGVIIGCYLGPQSWHGGRAIRDAGQISGNPFAHVSGFGYEKIKSGVYNELILNTSQGVKKYDIEAFSDRNNPVFQVVGFQLPCPMIYIYPKNYKDITDNLSEGLFMQAPSLPISANAVYNNARQAQDVGSMLQRSAMNYMMGDLPGFAMGVASSLGNMALQAYSSKFEAPTVIGNGMPVLTNSGNLEASLTVASPSLLDFNRIKEYFDYYGYALGEMSTAPNLDDKAYLQTGEQFLYGSEADAELNARLMSGIKIRTQLT